MNKINFRISFALLFFISLFTNAQVSKESVKNILEPYNNYYKNVNHMVYLSIPKDKYLKSENVWFKAYIFDTKTKKIDLRVAPIYVDLYNALGEKIKSKTLKNGLNKGDGFFNLDKLPEGVYHIQAYTSWQKNFDKKYYFKKTIILEETLEREIDWNECDLDLKVNSKTSNFIKNAQNDLVVRVRLCKTKGIYGAEGILKTSSGRLIQEFKTDVNGIASFSFIPNESNYNLSVKYKGKTINQKIKIEDTPSLSLKIVDRGISVKRFIFKNTNNKNVKDDKKYLLFIHNVGGVTYAKDFTVPDTIPERRISINKQFYSVGVNCVSVFDPITKERIINRYFYASENKVKNYDIGYVKNITLKDTIDYKCNVINSFNGEIVMGLYNASLRPNNRGERIYPNMFEYLHFYHQFQDFPKIFNLKNSEKIIDNFLVTVGNTPNPKEVFQFDSITIDHPKEYGINYKISKPTEFIGKPKLTYTIKNSNTKKPRFNYLLQSSPFDFTIRDIKFTDEKGKSSLALSFFPKTSLNNIVVESTASGSDTILAPVKEFSYKTRALTQQEINSRTIYLIEIDKYLDATGQADINNLPGTNDETKDITNKTVIVTDEMRKGYVDVFNLVANEFIEIEERGLIGARYLVNENSVFGSGGFGGGNDLFNDNNGFGGDFGGGFDDGGFNDGSSNDIGFNDGGFDDGGFNDGFSGGIPQNAIRIFLNGSQIIYADLENILLDELKRVTYDSFDNILYFTADSNLLIELEKQPVFASKYNINVYHSSKEYNTQAYSFTMSKKDRENFILQDWEPNFNKITTVKKPLDENVGLDSYLLVEGIDRYGYPVSLIKRLD